jgi:hypothetical protein
MRQMPRRLAAVIQNWLLEEGILAGAALLETPLQGSDPALAEAI